MRPGLPQRRPHGRDAGPSPHPSTESACGRVGCAAPRPAVDFPTTWARPGCARSQSMGVAVMRAFKALRGAAVPACAAVGVLVPWCGVSAAGAETISQTFAYSGAEQTFTVPAGVFSVRVLAVGGSGGSASKSGGAAAYVNGELSVTPGETLYVEVGGNGQNQDSGGDGGFNGGGNGGGGGGGASDVRTSPRASGLFPGDRLLVAGGGGGGEGSVSHFASGGRAARRANQDRDQKRELAATPVAALVRRAAGARPAPAEPAPARKVSSASAVKEARRRVSFIQTAVAAAAGAGAATTAAVAVAAVMPVPAAGAGAAPRWCRQGPAWSWPPQKPSRRSRSLLVTGIANTVAVPTSRAIGPSSNNKEISGPKWWPVPHSTGYHLGVPPPASPPASIRSRSSHDSFPGRRNRRHGEARGKGTPSTPRSVLKV